MKTLLIDNYDSFTYNLSQLWTAVSGEPPLVIRNDDWPIWNALDLADIEAVLISPGPGRPDHEGDFGISWAALRSGRPLLGVCLGHQGLCLAEGAQIVPAPEPVHGRTSPIQHSGTGLFAGIPAPFAAVRYHSLMVTDVPDTLEITATTPGPGGSSIVMAVQHRAKPQWGVQFHPESIATEHGHQLMANFRALATGARAPATGARLPATSARVVAVRPAPGEEQGPIVHDHRGGDGAEFEPEFELISQCLDAEPDAAALFAALFAAQPHAYWLDGSVAAPDSVDGQQLSILGGAGPVSEWVTAQAGSGQVSVEPFAGPAALAEGDLFGYLSAQLRLRRITAPELPFEFALGYVGFIGYELKADCGGDQAHHSGLPDAAFLFSDRAVVIDHSTHQTWLLSLTTRQTRAQTQEWLQDAAAAATHPEPARTPKHDDEQDVPVTYRHSPAQYAALVGACQEQIRAGETYEVNLTNQLTVDAALDPLDTFAELRRSAPAPYSALLRLGDTSVLSASPEQFLRITASGHIRTKPIKGTRRRGDTPVDDAEFARDLAQSAKDRAENLMIVDLLRNDLGSVATPGSVVVPRLFAVETFAAVHQLVSTVEAQLRPDRTAVDCVAAAFPGGSMTGAPKRRTMQLIDRLEGTARGPYSGALGYFSLTGAVELSVIIRTLVLHPDRVTLGAGGAVTALSDPEAEVAEMLLKTHAPLTAVRRAVAAQSAPGTWSVADLDAQGLSETGGHAEQLTTVDDGPAQ